MKPYVNERVIAEIFLFVMVIIFEGEKCFAVADWLCCTHVFSSLKCAWLFPQSFSFYIKNKDSETAVQQIKTICCMTAGQNAGKQGGFKMLRLTMSTEEYLMIGDNVKIVFLGGSRNHLRIMVDAPKEVDVVRSRVIENKITDEELRAKLPKYYAAPEIPEKFRKPKNIVIADSRKADERQSMNVRKPRKMQSAQGGK